MKLSTIRFICRLYAIAALIAAAATSSLAFAIVPLAALAAFLYVEFRVRNASLRLALAILLSFAIPQLLKPIFGLPAAALSLPLLVLLEEALRASAAQASIAVERSGPGDTTPHWLRFIGEGRPTIVLQSVLVSTFAVIILGLMFANWVLVLTAGITIAFIVVLGVLVLMANRKAPLNTDMQTHRVVAGDQATVPIFLTSLARRGGRVMLAPKDAWMHFQPAELMLQPASREAIAGPLQVSASFVAPLSGPGDVVAGATTIDPWGLFTSGHETGLFHLLVIPRAKRAEWMARKYLDMSAEGPAETVSSVRARRRASVRSGLEFYGLRPYQPGDSSKAIDWKHTLKLNEVTVREFQDTGVETALLLINLVASDEEARDRLAAGIITTALTLAAENIPATFSAYDGERVVLSTSTLAPRQGVVQALDLISRICVRPDVRHFLRPPDVVRLRADINRLKEADTVPANRLAALLQVEYEALSRQATSNPALMALNTALSVARTRPNVLALSGRNHDRTALALAEHSLKARGHQFIDIGLSAQWSS